MANKKHIARLRAGVAGWNQWRRENPGVRPDLQGAVLRGANLRGAVLRGAVLSRAKLTFADLTGANLSRAKLREADLSRAKLREAKLVEADLSQADLSQADLGLADLSRAGLSRSFLSGADLSRADLSRADLSRSFLSQARLDGTVVDGTELDEADLYRTIFAAVDLGNVRGLDTVQHIGPSIISIDTLYVSGGNIPESFLRGCGVPDSMIEYARSLVIAERPIDYYSCFISYSSHDEALARRLHADLQARGVRCWFAPHDMQIGDSIIDRIDQAIRLHEKLLLILSESSVASRWVGTEVKTALMREHNEDRTVLFPIRLDDAVMQSAAGWAGQVQERHIGDFCKWKDHDAYQAALARLLRDLKATPDR